MPGSIRCPRPGVEIGDRGVLDLHGLPVPDLDVEAERLVERHAVEDLVANVAGVALGARPVAPGLGMERIGVGVSVAPGIAEVVLGPGADRAGEQFAINVDLLVALAPPGGRGIEDVHEQADKAAGRSRNAQRGPVQGPVGLLGLSPS